MHVDAKEIFQSVDLLDDVLELESSAELNDQRIISSSNCKVIDMNAEHDKLTILESTIEEATIISRARVANALQVRCKLIMKGLGSTT